jgi:hypothetical protein
MWWKKYLYYAAIIIAAVLLYQLVLRLLGGSWGVESVFAGVLVLILTILVATVRRLAYLEGEYKAFRRSMGELAKDYKDLEKQITKFMHKHEFSEEKAYKQE